MDNKINDSKASDSDNFNEDFWADVQQPQVAETKGNGDVCNVKKVKRPLEVSPSLTVDCPVKRQAIQQPHSSNYVDSENNLNESSALIPGSSTVEVSSTKRKKCCISVVCSTLIASVGVVFLVLYLIPRGLCPSLKTPSYGKFDCSSITTKDGLYNDGTICSLHCNEGYGVRNGNQTFVCHGKNWTAIPSCSKLKNCTLLPVPANEGSINCTDGNYEMSTCEFSCQTGYNLRYDDKTKVDRRGRSVCVLNQTTAVWDAPEPYCVKATPCPPLQDLQRGKFSCSLPPNNNKQLTNGTVCTIECDKNSDVMYETNISCQEDGYWSSNRSTCVPACPKPALSNHLKIKSCTRRRFPDSTCYLACDSNFVLVGDNTLECRNSSTGPRWNKDFPRCLCPLCLTGDNCDKSISWTEASNNLIQKNKTFNSDVRYEGHTIDCIKVQPPNTKYKSAVVCRDLDSKVQQQCNSEGADVSATARDALATLILKNVYHNKYSLPCDAELMPKPCVKIS